MAKEGSAEVTIRDIKCKMRRNTVLKRRDGETL